MDTPDRERDSQTAELQTNNGKERDKGVGQLPKGISAEEILANFSEAFLVLDRDWRIVYANEEAARINRKQPEKFLGVSHWEEWPATVGTEIERQYRRVMDERVPAQFEHFYDGASRLWLEIHAYPCEVGIAIYYRDITERKRAERELANREKELRDFFENATTALHWVGLDGTILWANNAELNLLGYTCDEYIGHNIREFHVDESVIADILSRLKRNENLRDYEARLRCKDGSMRHVSISSNVYWENDRFVHTRCFTRDITEEKRTAELQERLAAIVESSDDAIVSKDLNGIIRSWNQGAERIFGYTAEEIVGKPITTLAVPENINEIPNILKRISRGERVEHYVTQRRTKHGKVLTVSLTVSPIRDAWGKIIGASKVARDITDRERAQQALREANAALLRANADLEQFAYSASHDLQEPLRMVATYSEMLKRKFAGKLGAAGEEYLGYTLEGALRMEALLRDLRAFTQASTASQEPAEELDANKALQRTLASLQAAIKGSGASITYTNLPCVRMHEFQLEQLFQNLIGNAIRYRSKAPPQIHVAAERHGNEWLFSIQDNGIGIDPKYKEQIFGMFKRLHTSAEYPGTGMGLAICERIVQRTKGRIWVESELGRGSTFYFTVPVG